MELRAVPTTDEIAAVFHVSSTSDLTDRAVYVHRSADATPSSMSILNPLFPCQYPLLFSHGTLGWRVGDASTANASRASFTLMQYTKYRLLQDRRFLQFSRLSCEYACGMYSRMVDERLQFIQKGRRHLINLQEHEMDDGNGDDDGAAGSSQQVSLVRQHTTPTM